MIANSAGSAGSWIAGNSSPMTAFSAPDFYIDQFQNPTSTHSVYVSPEPLPSAWLPFSAQPGARFLAGPAALFSTLPEAVSVSGASGSSPAAAGAASSSGADAADGSNGGGGNGAIDEDAIVEEVALFSESTSPERRQEAAERLLAFGQPALDCIMRLLAPTGEHYDHPDERLRPLAVRALALFDDPAVPTMLCHLVRGDESCFVRIRATQALAEVFPKFDYPLVLTTLIEASKVNKDVNVRNAAIKALAAKRNARALRALFDGVEAQHPFSMVTCEASQALFEMKFTSDENLRRLLFTLTTEMLSHERASVRAFAASEISHYRDAGAVPHLIERLRIDSDANVVAFAARSLGELKDARAIPALIEVASGRPPGEATRLAANALCDMVEHVDAKTFLKAVTRAGFSFAQNGDFFVRALRSKGQGAIFAALEAVNELEKPAKLEAIKALGWIGAPEAAAPLVALLRGEEKEERAAGFVALMQLGLTTALPELTQAMSDESVTVRVLAARLLARIDDPRALDVLYAAIQGPEDRDVRLEAFSVFEKILAPSKNALDDRAVALLREVAISDEDELVSMMAMGALYNHGNDPRAREALSDIAANAPTARARESANDLLKGAIVCHLPWWQRRTRHRGLSGQ
jgi:HEAT repeat protein